ASSNSAMILRLSAVLAPSPILLPGDRAHLRPLPGGCQRTGPRWSSPRTPATGVPARYAPRTATDPWDAQPDPALFAPGRGRNASARSSPLRAAFTHTAGGRSDEPAERRVRGARRGELSGRLTPKPGAGQSVLSS